MPRTFLNRRLSATLAGATAAVVLLAGCSSPEPETGQSPSPTPSSAAPTAEASADPSATPTPEPITPSANLDGITVTGEQNAEPQVTIPSPFAVEQTMNKVLVEGNGAEIKEGGIAELHYVGLNGRTGEKFDDSYSRGETVEFTLSQVVPGFQKGLTGQKVGSRVLIAMPGSDGYDSSGGNPNAGIEVGDTLVFVVDIVAAPLDIASGTEQPAPEGAPTVQFGEDNKPTITIPTGTQPPTELQTHPLIVGTGKQVGEGDTITVQYAASSWRTGEEIIDIYGAPEQGQLSKMIPAWQEALVNQPVGSRILIVAPPDKAYPEGSDRPRVQAGDTVVFVVDILWTAQSQAGF